MPTKKILFCSSLLLCLLFQKTGAQDLKLWYQQPAQYWNEALPIGNGKLAAMVFGNPGQELLQLNEETIWNGRPHNNVADSQSLAINEIRDLLYQKKFAEAQALSKAKIKAIQNGMSYQPAADLMVQFSHHDKVIHYRRELDIQQAKSLVEYDVDDIHFTREVIASFRDNVIVLHIKASKPKSLSFIVSLKSPQKQNALTVKDNLLTLTGTPGVQEQLSPAIHFEAVAQTKITDGILERNDTAIKVTNATDATIYVSIATNFQNYKQVDGNPHTKAIGFLQNASVKKFDVLLKENIQYYRQYFDRVALDLGTSEAVRLPTDERLKQFSARFDPQFITLYFQFGRYLLISGSQPGSQPTNLQGKWNDKLNPAWDSKYTININTEMNYWPSEITNLSELGEPLFRMIKDLSVTGQESASKLYHARGWMLHHNTDLWRITGPVDGGFYGMWPMGGAWLSRHLWEHYLFTGDKKFLAEIYPVLKGAATYYVDALQKEPDHGWWVVSPSMSPENTFMNSGIGITYGTTMDNQIVYELFSNTIKAAKVLSTDLLFADTLEQKRSLLPPMQIGQYGQLQEWIFDWDKKNDRHRHISHLFGLYPSNQISPTRTPELFAAAKTTLLSRGDISTGWSMGWKVNFWARMKDGDHAYKLISNQLTLVHPDSVRGQSGGTYPNLFDAHPPFQIDGNFGCTAGIAEMLLQSQDGAIEILPALPSAWKNGSVKGLCSRGGYIIDITWQDNLIKKITVKSTLGGLCRLRLRKNSFSTTPGELSAAKGANTNMYFATDEIKKPLISPKAGIEKLPVNVTADFDVITEKNKTYTFNF
jgi:alpha-L-fucosidase 2